MAKETGATTENRPSVATENWIDQVNAGIRQGFLYHDQGRSFKLEPAVAGKAWVKGTSVDTNAESRITREFSVYKIRAAMGLHPGQLPQPA